MKPGRRAETLLSRREVEGLIANGRSIIIVDQQVLKVDAWLQYHPGGDKAIKHMVGRDATDEVNGCAAFAPLYSPSGFSLQVTRLTYAVHLAFTRRKL